MTWSSSVCVNSVELFAFKFIVTVRANMSTPELSKTVITDDLT
jgi:hypothetical protein